MANETRVSQWTETELRGLIGQSESARLEFKSGKLSDQEDDKIALTLSKEVSAFANSEGGLLVLGMSEEKAGKTPVAATLDGIDPDKVRLHWLEQVIESNVSPYLPGIHVKGIPLSGSLQGRMCVVVSVPKGVTAYQAKDRRYYGRSEFEVHPLPDHEIWGPSRLTPN